MMTTNNTTVDFVQHYINLAQPRLGTKVVSCTDDFFATCERMLQPDDAIFIDGKFDDNGKWMDGWETRRRRNQGFDSAIIKLGKAGTIYGVDIDTTHFTGNYPPAASLEACHSDSVPDENTEWVTLIPTTKINGDSHHFMKVDIHQVWTHVRLNIFPDGGIARLRLYGRIFNHWNESDNEEQYDLIALENGGRAIAWNDAHFGSAHNLLLPEKGLNMGDGWETRRRREPGNDWCIIELGHAGIIEQVLVDTAFFKGNYPDSCSIQAANIENGVKQSLVTQSMFWQELLPAQKLSADSEHIFTDQLQSIGAITHIRFNVIPDGGVSRLRVKGKLA